MTRDAGRPVIFPEAVPLSLPEKRSVLSPRPAIPPARRRLYALITLLVPVLFFTALEITLRLAHYGPDLSLFTTESLSGVQYHVMNPSVKNRYFWKVDFSPSTSPDYFLVPKPRRTFRIFCLGGSTTVGYPYWYNGSFSSFLRDRLHALYPDRSIEVINLGMTATNSFTVLDIARDLTAYEPDCFVVYDGHNEFYGALGVASRESVGRSRWLTLTYLRLIHARTFLLVRDLYGRATQLFASRSEPQEAGTMMERLARGQYIPLGSLTYREGLQAFRENLRDLADLCRHARIPLILGTQVSNLRNRAPFVSGPPPGVTPGDRLAFQTRFNEGERLLLDGEADSALGAFQGALQSDSLRAETVYRIGCALDSAGRPREAERAYVRARDLDQLRFRTSSDFNRAILESADGASVAAVDIEQVFRAHSPDSLIGNELIMEHLHPRLRGYFLMGRAYTGALKQMGLLGSSTEWESRDTVDDASLWNERCVTDLDERTARRRTEALTSGWPFTAQYPIVDALPAGDTLGQIAEHLTRGTWNWLHGHEAAADYYAGRGEWENVGREYRTIVNQIPHDIKARLRLAHFYLQQGKLDDMRRELLASLETERTILAYRALGDLAMQRGAFADAASYYEKMDPFQQSAAERVANGYLLASAYAQSGRSEKATAQLLKVLAIRPDYQPAVELLSKLNTPHH
jgi:tetratricopeptide (TPR) repeat protein